MNTRMRLLEAGEDARVRDAHLEYFIELARTLAPAFVGAEQKEALEAMQDELDNVRAALDWAYESGKPARGLELTVELTDFWIRRTYFSEGRRRLQQAIEETARDGPTQLRSRAFSALGTLASMQGDFANAILNNERALEISRALNDERGIAYILHTLGVQNYRRGDLKRARAYYTESLALARTLDETRLIAFDLNSLGHIEWLRGDHARGIVLTEESLALMRELGDKHSIAIRLQNLAEMALYQDELERCENILNECLALVEEMNYKWGMTAVYMLQGALRRKQNRIAESIDVSRHALALAQELGARDLATDTLEGIAKSYDHAGRPNLAAQLLGAVDTLRAQIELERQEPEQQDYFQTVTRLQETLGTAQFDAEYAKGKELTLAQALELI